MKFWTPNIETSGRVARGLCGTVSLVAAWLCRDHLLSGATLALAGVFMIFEAARGWCLARACGFKTPM